MEPEDLPPDRESQVVERMIESSPDGATTERRLRMDHFHAAAAEEEEEPHHSNHSHDNHHDMNDINWNPNHPINDNDGTSPAFPLPPPPLPPLPPPSTIMTNTEDHDVVEATVRDRPEEPANKRPRVSESPPILVTTAPTTSSTRDATRDISHTHTTTTSSRHEIVVEDREPETEILITQPPQPPEPHPPQPPQPNQALFLPPPPPPPQFPLPHSSELRSMSRIEFLKQINDLRSQFQPRRQQPQQQPQQLHRSIPPFDALRPVHNPRLPSATAVGNILRHHHHHHHHNTAPNQAEYLPMIPNFRSTWNEMVPRDESMRRALHMHSTAAPTPKKMYQLSLLNVNEFTIEGMSPQWNRNSVAPTSIQGLRQPIRQICRKHGVKAVYDTLKSNVTLDGEDDITTTTTLATTAMYPSNGDELVGKWRIPLSVYHELAGYLSTLENTEIRRIPDNQLRIASLERARQEKGYPDADVLVQYGVPLGLANALAPFQRGGVDFVRDRKGRAWIADDMGLGKTIQGVASMAMYHNEWPLLVLCPSGARYHWENEFKQWLGVDSSVNRTIMNNDEDTIDNEGDKVFPDSNRKRPHDTSLTSQPNIGPLLHDWQINVLGSSKSEIFPFPDTKVVICSYGLSSVLIDTQKIVPKMFRCAIVDESHMLKNKAAKRTSLLLPVLEQTDRCVLLSGTPALARPVELWPQLAILGPENQHGWNVGTEPEFMDKYVRNGNPQRSAELHTMLRGTVMLRRLKKDILKTLPQKIREKAEVHVMANMKQRTAFKYLLGKLREGKGVLGKLARLHHTENKSSSVEPVEDQHFNAEAAAQNTIQEQMKLEQDHLHQYLNRELSVGQNQIRESLLRDMRLNDEQKMAETIRLEGDLHTFLGEQSMDGRRRIEEKYSTQLKEIAYAEDAGNSRYTVDTDESRSAILSRLYSLTGDVKVPLIVDTLKRWLADPTKGKLCVFAHHIAVLDAIRDEVGLSNSGTKSGTKYIRIDGQTLPKARQEQINAFQTDLSIRVALLGITAAGVAVTLTASSTVWFAELFWTPAIMIQAEDRCHRIGQNARVKCLYFVAKGTMDDILWKLLEKKFRDLGEFVEGKEKLKITVNKTYDGHRALQSTLFDVDASDESDSQNDDNDIDFGDDFQLDGEFEHDIEALGEEERRMLQSLDPDADEVDNNAVVELNAPADLEPGDTKVPAIVTSDLVENGIGKSEDDAISLSDDDDDDDDQQKAPAPVQPVQPIDDLRSDHVLDGCRLYRTRFNESTLGVQLGISRGRMVVAGVRPDRISRCGPNAKPQVGDIFCCVQGLPIPLFRDMEEGVDYLKRALKNVPIELTFVEAPTFIARYQTLLNHIARKALVPAIATSANLLAQNQNGLQTSATRSAVPDVIELLDD